MNEFKVKNGLIVSGSAEIEQDLRVKGTLTVDEFHTSITTSSIIYESGSTAFGNSLDDTHILTGSVEITGSISLNGEPIGTGKLNEETFNTYTASYNVATTDFNGLTSSYNSFTSSYINDSSSFNSRVGALESFSSSLDTTFVSETEFGAFSSSVNTHTSSLNTFTSSINTTIKNKLNADGVISGSVQILGGSNIVSSSTQVAAYGFATTGSNLFIGTQTHSGSILPSVDNLYDLGSTEYQWRDVYISSGSLYIDGTKVISSTAQELVITTDNGQSIKILEGTTDSIVLQTADGDIELKSSADGDILLDPTNGKIMLKGPVEILNGQKIQSSVGGTPVVFANDIVVSGSIDITGTIEGIDLTAFSSSVNTRLTNLESSGGSLNLFTASAASSLNALENTTSSLNTYTSSANSKFTSIETVTSSFVTYSGTTNGRLTTIETSTSSLNSFTSSTATKFNTIEVTTASLNSFTSSTITRINTIETSTSSLNSFTSSIDTTIKNKLNTDGVISGSVQVTLSNTNGYSTFSSSLATTDLNQDNRLNSLEGKTGSYATTGSNIFVGNQTITGSLTITQNLTVLGSSSLLIVTSSQLALSSSTISVNVFEPAERFGGLKVYDSGSESHLATASLLWDSQKNHWIYQNASGSNYSGGMLLSGPRNTGSLGDEIGLISGRIAKSVGGDHLDNSNIADNGTLVTINSNTDITGTLTVSNGKIIAATTGGDEGGEILLGKAETNTTLTGSGITIDVYQNKLRFFEQGGAARGGYFDISTLAGGASTNLMGTAATASYVEYSNVANKPSLVSGSSQISFNGITDKPTLVSGSSQITYSGLSGVPSGIVSGSSQITFGSITGVPSGIVSGSSQITYSGLSGIPSGIVSGSSQITFGSITGVPSGLVSGSSQITYSSISGIPSGIVSGSSQITYSGLTGIPGGIVSGSAQIDLTATTNYSTGIKTRLNAEGVLSGSAQVVAALPSGTVSGSAQITNIANSQLVNSSFNIGTTSISLGRASASQTLSGVSIDGNAGTVTNGVYTTGNQTIGGTKTFSATTIISLAGFAGIEYYNATAQWQGYIGTENNTGNLRYNSFNGTHTWYANGTQTMSVNSSGRLSLTGSNSGSEPLVNLTASGTGTFQRGVRMLNSGMSAGNSIMYAVGQADSSKNMGQFYFYYAGSGSNSNRISMGLHSVDDVFNIWGNGDVEIGSTFNSGYKLDVAGQIRSYAGSSLVLSMSTVAANDAVIAARWTSGTGMEMRYHPNSAVGYIQNTYQATSGQEFGDIHFRHNVGGTMTTRMLMKAETGFVGIGTTPTQRLHVNGFVRANGISVFETGGTISAFIGYEKNWFGSGSSNNLTIAAEGGNTIGFYTNGTTVERVRVANDGLRVNPNSSAYASYLWLNREINQDGGILLSKNTTLDWQINNTGSSGDLVIYSYGVGQVIMNIERANGNMTYRGNIVPQSNGTNNLGSSSLRWNTVFTSDLSMSNGIGDYTIVEGEEDLFIYNNKTNKVFKFLLQEVDPSIVPAKKI